MMGVKQTDGNLMMLYALYLAALSLGNLLDDRFIMFFNVLLPASVLAYPVTLLVTCIISELWAREDAYKLVVLAISIKFLGIILLGLAQVITMFPTGWARQDLWDMLGTSFWEVAGRFVLGKNIRFWAGSIVSFAIAQYLGIWTFNAVRDYHIRRCGSPWGGRWFRYLIGALTGEVVETVVFLSLVFLPMWGMLWPSMIQQVYTRGIMTLTWLPLFYMLTWRRRKNG